jgi:hypothetical protein
MSFGSRGKIYYCGKIVGCRKPVLAATNFELTDTPAASALVDANYCSTVHTLISNQITKSLQIIKVRVIRRERKIDIYVLYSYMVWDVSSRHDRRILISIDKPGPNAVAIMNSLSALL